MAREYIDQRGDYHPAYTNKMQRTEGTGPDSSAISAEKLVDAAMDKLSDVLSSSFDRLGATLKQAISEPLRQLEAAIVKDVLSGVTAQFGSIFEPRDQARQVAQQFAASGHPLTKEEFEQYFKLLSAEADRKAQAVDFANKEMGSVMQPVFQKLASQLPALNQRAEDRFAWIQKEVQDNWRTQARE